jgi:hypothetical protein
MKKVFMLLLVIAAVIVPTTVPAQVDWYLSDEAYIGYKAPYETEYTYVDHVYDDKIKIKVEPDEVVIYASALTHLRVLGTLVKEKTVIVYQAIDQENTYCKFTIGFDAIAESVYMSVQYPTYILFYYLYEK